MPEQRDLQSFKGKHHHVYYFQGRRHVIFRGKLLRSMRVFQWFESQECYREIFDRF
jgi:hypothetical protein